MLMAHPWMVGRGFDLLWLEGRCRRWDAGPGPASMLHFGEQLISALKNEQTDSLRPGGAGSNVAGGCIPVNHHIGMKSRDFNPSPALQAEHHPAVLETLCRARGWGLVESCGDPEKVAAFWQRGPLTGMAGKCTAAFGGSQTCRAPGIPLEAPCTRIKPAGRADYPAGTCCLRVREQLP